MRINLSISVFSNSRAFSPAWFQTELIERMFWSVHSMHCLEMSMWLSISSHISRNSASACRISLLFWCTRTNIGIFLQVCIQRFVIDSLNYFMLVHLVFSWLFSFYCSAATVIRTNTSFSFLSLGRGTYSRSISMPINISFGKLVPFFQKFETGIVVSTWDRALKISEAIRTIRFHIELDFGFIWMSPELLIATDLVSFVLGDVETYFASPKSDIVELWSCQL